MEAEDKVVLDYFYEKIKERIHQLAQDEIKRAEYNAALLTGGLGPEVELKFYEDLLHHKMEVLKSPSGHYHLPVKFTQEELQRKEFDTPSIIENRREVYKSPYQERKDDFILLVARGYSDLDVIQHLKSRIIDLKAAAAKPQSLGSQNGYGKTSLIWTAGKVKLKKLHASLINERIIGEIDFNLFEKHFTGVPQAEMINFLLPKALVFYLLDKLEKYIQARFYTGEESTSSALVTAKHFVFKGKVLKDPYSVKSKGKEPKNRVYKQRINLIVNSLEH